MGAAGCHASYTGCLVVGFEKKQIETDVLGPRADTLSHTDTIENMSNSDT